MPMGKAEKESQETVASGGIEGGGTKSLSDFFKRQTSQYGLKPLEGVMIGNDDPRTSRGHRVEERHMDELGKKIDFRGSVM